MFGIGGGELFFIILVVLMLFGSDKVPEMARTLGKGMQQLKNATNDLKGEIHKSADIDGVKKSITDIVDRRSIDESVTNIKKSVTDVVDTKSISNNINEEAEKVKEDIESLSGPIKRMR